jgi:drug/metabolite transporter (DMT)-like permease
MNDVLLLCAIALLTASQVLQKVGATRRLAPARGLSARLGALLSPELLGAGVCLCAGTALWLAVLYRMDVSRAFPMLSVGSIAVVLASRFYLGEPVSVRRWIGVSLVALGIALVAAT